MPRYWGRMLIQDGETRSRVKEPHSIVLQNWGRTSRKGYSIFVYGRRGTGCEEAEQYPRRHGSSYASSSRKGTMKELSSLHTWRA